MENIDYKLLANKLMFDLNEEELKDMDKTFQYFLKQLEVLDEIDTTDVEEMIYPIETSVSYLRNDEDVYTLSKEEVLKNGMNTLDDYFIVPKVVK